MASTSRSAPFADRKKLSTTRNYARTTSSSRSKGRAASSPRRLAAPSMCMALRKSRPSVPRHLESTTRRFSRSWALARAKSTPCARAAPSRKQRNAREMPGHVANRLQAALAREVYYLVADGVVSAADVDTALCWGPGLRWGVMGNMMLNHLGGGPGGIEHFFQQFTGPMTAWWKTLGSPVLTPEVQKKLIDSVHA